MLSPFLYNKRLDTMEKGIDISEWQENVDFEKVKKDVDFVILREGYGGTIDKYFLQYVRGCKAHGIPIVGVYHFCYSTSSAEVREEAKVCLANIEKAGLSKDDIVVFFDFEYDTIAKAKKKGINLGKNECILFTHTFCEYVQEHGYKAGVYANIDYVRTMYDDVTLKKYVFWLADYSGNPDVSCAFHQYSSSGTVNGINGNVDMDYRYTEGVNTMGVTAKQVVDIMNSWIGLSRANGTHKPIIDIYNSHIPLARGYAVSYNDDYCDTTVSAAFIKLNAVDLIGGTECGVEEHVKIFKSKGIWEEDGTIAPEVGYICVYNWDDDTQPNDGWSDHIGVVASVNKSKKEFTVTEGNMSGGVVGQRTIPFGWGYIRGFAKPAYTKESTTSSSHDATLIGNCTVQLHTFLAGAVDDQIKSIQTILNRLGYKGKTGKKLKVNGKLDANTAYAITNFQKDNGMKNINFGTVASRTWELMLNSK